MNVYVPVASAQGPATPPRGRRATPARPVGRVLRIALPIALLASTALFHAFTHVRVVSAGYELGRVEAEHRRLLAERDRLRVEVATLRAPGRLERFARAQLRMAPPAPGAVIAGRAGGVAAGEVRAGVVGGVVPAPAEPFSSSARVALRQEPGAARGAAEVQ
jgi:cell division protein FtsL